MRTARPGPGSGPGQPGALGDPRAVRARPAVRFIVEAAGVGADGTVVAVCTAPTGTQAGKAVALAARRPEPGR